MLLLASDLLAIALCIGSDGSELGPVDTTLGVIVAKLHGAPRSSAAVLAATLAACASVHTALLQGFAFASAQDLEKSRRIRLQARKMCRPGDTDGALTLRDQFSRQRSHPVLPCMTAPLHPLLFRHLIRLVDEHF